MKLNLKKSCRIEKYWNNNNNANGQNDVPSGQYGSRFEWYTYSNETMNWHNGCHPDTYGLG